MTGRDPLTGLLEGQRRVRGQGRGVGPPAGGITPTLNLRRLGARIRQARRDAGLSQDAFAWEAGIHRTHASLIERGRSDPRLSTLARIARALNVNLAELLAGVEKDPR